METESSDGAETFAVYLAKQFIAKKGFVTDTVPELADLAPVSDIILTRSDGVTFQVICMIDREANPEKRFEMSRDAVEEIGKQCLQYSGTVSGNKMPITIQIMEIGRTPIIATDRDRLKALKRRRSIFSKVVISAWILDTTTASVWSSSAFSGLFAGRRFMERLMRAPRVPGAELQEPAPAVIAHERFPTLTVMLLAVLAAVFTWQQIYGIGPSTGLLAPSIQTLIALGALNRNLVFESGEWYRIFSSTLLHRDLVHLLLNGLALYLVGTVLESLVGRAWFVALFVIGAVGGALMSLALNPATAFSVGASGAIMGLLAAALACSFRFPAGPIRMRMQTGLLQVLIPALIPIAVSRTGQHIDFAGHLGGALIGALVGLGMLKTWRGSSLLPSFRSFAELVSLGGFAAFAFAFFPIASEYQSYKLELILIPNDQLPKSYADAQSQSSDLVARFPHDPRSHLFHATTLLEKRDLVGAEQELRAGLAEDGVLKSKFSPELEFRLRTMLALLLLDRREPDEARAVALRVCSELTSGPMRDALDKVRLCNLAP